MSSNKQSPVTAATHQFDLGATTSGKSLVFRSCRTPRFALGATLPNKLQPTRLGRWGWEVAPPSGQTVKIETREKIHLKSGTDTRISDTLEGSFILSTQLKSSPAFQSHTFPQNPLHKLANG